MTDTKQAGTKDGTSVVTPQSALKEAVERVTAALQVGDRYGEGVCFGANEHGYLQFTDLRTILATLSSQAESLEAMASALEPFAKAGELFVDHQSEWAACIYNPAAGDEYSLDSDDLSRARTTLSQYRKTGDL